MTLPRNESGLQAAETYEYDLSANNTSRGLVTKITHNDNNRTYQSFGYDSYGNKLWQENELREHTSYLYDSYNRPTKTTDPLWNFETFSYLKPGASSSYLHTTNSVYTYTSRAGIVTTNAYDANFRKTSSSVAGTTTWFHYDAVGNQDYVTDPRGNTTYTDYDTRNRKTAVREPLGRTTQFVYGDGINVTTIVRPDTFQETKTYDAMNRLIIHTVPKSAGVDLTTRFGYWPSGKLFWVLDPNGQTTYLGYNESDQLNEIVYPELTEFQSWAYDDAHNLASRTTVNGNANPASNEVQRFHYDIRNRKISMSWDNSADWATFDYYDDGRLKTATNANSTVYREYDDAGRLKLDRQTVNGVGASVDVNHGFDNDGKENHLWVTPALSPAYDYTYGYDTMGRLKTITPTGGNLAFQVLLRCGVQRNPAPELVKQS